MKTFTDETIERLGKDFFDGRTVYDIGCYNVSETKKFLGLGAKIVGMDKSTYADAPEGISFTQEDFLEWSQRERLDILYSKNVVLFMDSKKVSDKIAELNPNVFIIQTMYDYPEPNWPPEVLKKLSFTRAEDWTTLFEGKGYETLHAESYESQNKDMKGNVRKFRLTEYIGQKI